MLRIDCSAPRVLDARFDRDLARITIELSEPVDPATVGVGGASDAIRVTDAEASEIYRAPALSFPTETTIELALDGAPGAWWRDRPVRLQVGPPVADLEGNVTDGVFETVFFPGSSSGLSGGFLFGETYDDLSGRPLAGASAKLFAAGSRVARNGCRRRRRHAGRDGDRPTAEGATSSSARLPSGRYVLALGADGYTTVYRRLSLSPTRGLVPFDGRPTPAGRGGGVDRSGGRRRRHARRVCGWRPTPGRSPAPIRSRSSSRRSPARACPICCRSAGPRRRRSRCGGRPAVRRFPPVRRTGSPAASGWRSRCRPG